LNDIEQASEQDLAGLKYQSDICEHLKTHEKGLWDWFSSDRFSEQYVEHQKLELLKSTFRLSQQSNARLYQIAEKACEALGINCDVTLYQGQAAGDGLNAELLFLPEDIAIILRGDILAKLDEDELLAVLAHETAHHKLYTIDNGQYFTAMRVLSWCGSQPDCPIPFYETARRYQLFTEIYADLGSLHVTGQWQATISSLIKVTTGLSDVVVDDYLSQADEVLDKSDAGSQGSSHPETYMRAKVLSMAEEGGQWYQDTAALVLGKLDVVSLDLLDQISLSKASKTLIALVTEQPCMRTETLEAMAQQYFPKYEWTEISPARDELISVIESSKDKTLEYLSYILLDFATADPELEPVSAVIAFQLAQALNLDSIFEPILRRELKQTKGDIKNLLSDAQGKIEAANHATKK